MTTGPPDLAQGRGARDCLVPLPEGGVGYDTVMTPSTGIDPLAIQRSVDQRVFLYGVSWNDYEAQDGRIGIFALRGDRYERVARSEFLPQVDVELVRSLLEVPTQTAAVRALRARLRQPR